MGKGAKGLNLYFVIILILLLVTVWVSTIQEKGDSYTRGELVKQLEAGDVSMHRLSFCLSENRADASIYLVFRQKI